MLLKDHQDHLRNSPVVRLSKKAGLGVGSCPGNRGGKGGISVLSFSDKGTLGDPVFFQKENPDDSLKRQGGGFPS